MQNFVAFNATLKMLRSVARINQQVIAKELNLSQTTVSRSLANHPAINAETKAMVLEAAAKLGYNQRIKRTNGINGSRRTPIWGVLIAYPKTELGPSETFQQVLRGVANKSSQQDAILDVVYFDPGMDSESQLLRRIRSSRWKGCVLIYPVNPSLAHGIANQVACVSIIENYRHDLIDSVDVDQSDSVFSLVKSLQEAGHQKIGFFSWTYSVEAPWVLHRMGSFVEALYRCELPFDPNTSINVRPSERLVPKDAANRVMQLREDGVTAFVCAADHQAYGLIPYLQQAGLRIPEDLSLTGFDGIPVPAGAQQLTTVRVPYEELGRSAIHQLTRRIEQPTAPRRHLLVDGDFITGATIGPPHTRNH
jgi:LacI family transcriptional regulator